MVHHVTICVGTLFSRPVGTRCTLASSDMNLSEHDLCTQALQKHVLVDI